MKDAARRENLATLLQTNKLFILVEIVVVFLPLYLGLALSKRMGSDYVALGGELVLRQGPLVYLGLIISLLLLWGASRLRGVSWDDFGLTRPKSWFHTMLMSLGVALAVLAAVIVIINPIMNIANLPPQDLSGFAYLAGDLPNLLVQLVLVWITAGFLEEFMFRGYLMVRLLDLVGKETKNAWALAILGQAIIFGLVHSQQGLGGMFKVGVIGLVFGLAYLFVGRNLWPLIIAHALIDSIDMVQHFFGR
jgi:membrane protease YdiL (CAAX protease family)